MNIELQQKLLEKYPKIFKINNPRQWPFDFYQFKSWEGWYDLIDKTAAEIQKILDSDKESYFNTLQNKQKFASLRWYYSCDNKNLEKFREIINKAEEESLSICEKCGTKENVSQNRGGYILTLCDKCRYKNEQSVI